MPVFIQSCYNTFQHIDEMYSGGVALFGFHQGSVFRKSRTDSSRSASDWDGVFYTNTTQ